MSTFHQARQRVGTRPLGPLLDQFRTRADGTCRGGGTTAIELARDQWLNTTQLDTADDATLQAAIEPFVLAVLNPAFHQPWADRRIRQLRHALNHLLRGQDPVPERFARCIIPEGAYFVLGLGMEFWSALLKALDPRHMPRWSPLTILALKRLGLWEYGATHPTSQLAIIVRAYDLIRTQAPDLDASDIDWFLVAVAQMQSRDLALEEKGDPFPHWHATTAEIETAIRTIRVRKPLRQRIRAMDELTLASLKEFSRHSDAGEFEEAWRAFANLDPGHTRAFAIASLDDADSPALTERERARLWCETAGVLRTRYRVHPLELADLLAEVHRARTDPDPHPTSGRFGGFCSDTFRFLHELAAAKSKEWMQGQRERYQFVLREPLIELCESLAQRYVQPVLNGEYAWDLEFDARPGRALTSICKNDFGRSTPYQSVQWVTYYRRSQANRRADAQFFVRISAQGIRYGFHLGRTARDAGRVFRRNVQIHAESLLAALHASGVLEECQFWAGDELDLTVPVQNAADLRAWAAHKTLAIGKSLLPITPLLRQDALIGEILLTFDRLVPAFACAAEEAPLALLNRRSGAPAGIHYNSESFTQETHLSEPWLDRVTGLLRLKRQIILQGVPGTGKTHVARCLARLLTHDRPECVRLVQFHPAYSYEEFVEGIRARSTQVNDRTELTYPVENGVLCEFAAQAATRPSEPHVLIIDELNRGNLPRIFGELLYLLEYRDQGVTLPYSKRAFQLPDNLFILATMNNADRSAVALDQALRRRFSFVDMPPDAAILAHWLEAHPPATADDSFGPRVVQLFDELNRRLNRDLGPDRQVGHSVFMVPNLNPHNLQAVWEHHVRPLLLDYFGGRGERLADYHPDRLLGTNRRVEKRV